MSWSHYIDFPYNFYYHGVPASGSLLGIEICSSYDLGEIGG